MTLDLQRFELCMVAGGLGQYLYVRVVYGSFAAWFARLGDRFAPFQQKPNLFRRAVWWLAKREIAQARTEGWREGRESGWQDGVGKGYALGHNRAVNAMRAEMEAARAELNFVRALYPLYRPSQDGSMPFLGAESKRIH